jgi:CoA:oxalate CoA-transferase
VSYALGGGAYSTPFGGVGPDRLEDDPPLMAWGWNAAFIAGFNAVWGTMLGLFRRRRNGHGSHVDVSEQASLAATERAGVAEAFLGEQSPGWSRQRRAGMGTNQIFPAKDGYVAIGAVDDLQFKRWVSVMGNPEWAQSELFSTLTARIEYGEALRAYAGEWTKQHTKDEIYRSLQEELTVAFPVYTPEEVVGDAHNQARELMAEQIHPSAGSVRTPGAPFKLSGTPWQLVRPAPILGQHNTEILCERLGLTHQELAALRERGEA